MAITEEPATSGADGAGGRWVRPFEGFDTREALRNATRQAEERGLYDMLVVDADAHHYESDSWPEVMAYLDDPILVRFAVNKITGGNPLGFPEPGFDSDLAGRITRYGLGRQEVGEPGANRELSVMRRSLEAMALDYQVVFPSPMLTLGMHPDVDVEVAVSRAYARWLTERVLAEDSRMLTMIYLPFNDVEASLKMIAEFADAPGVVGFMVTSVRHQPVHHKSFMPVYRAIEETGKPLAFHAGQTWTERSFQQLNRFLSVHALGFPYYNMIHLTNWIVNGLPERFPALKVVWIEAGLAWLPFISQRLDNEYLMRSSEAPLLKRRPSEYIREMYFSSQPMEYPEKLEWLESTFDQINAKTQLLFASDWPHWDFDLPATIYDLPFLDDQSRRNILGENALRLFDLAMPEKYLT
jgi:hypothetical protein